MKRIKGGNAFLRMLGLSKPDDAEGKPASVPAPALPNDAEGKPASVPALPTNAEEKPAPKTGPFGLWGGKKSKRRRTKSNSKSKSKKRR